MIRQVHTQPVITTSRSTISRPIVPPAAGIIIKRIGLTEAGEHIDDDDGLISVGVLATFVVSEAVGSIVDVGHTVEYSIVDMQSDGDE